MPKVLPSGIGHTTSCFLSVEGSNKPVPFIITEDGNDFEIEQVQQLANALRNLLRQKNRTENPLGRRYGLSKFNNVIKDEIYRVKLSHKLEQDLNSNLRAILTRDH